MKYYITSALIFCFTSIFGQTNSAINKFIQNPNLTHSSIGICIKDMSGKDVVSYNKHISLTPASTLKVLTTATALEILSDSYRFPTEIAIDKSDPQHLIIQGYGDPTLGSEFTSEAPTLFLETWASRISKSATKAKPISITIVDDYFSYNGISAKWLHEDIGNYYAAGAYGISIFDNTYRLYLNSMQTVGCPTIVKTVPLMKDIVFQNNLKLNNTGKDNAFINGLPFSYSRTLVGDIPTKRTSFVIKGSIPDPGLVLANTLAKKLEENGYKISKVETSRKLYLSQVCSGSKNSVAENSIIYKNVSPPLKDIIKIINVKSNNHYSEHLIRAIGRNRNNDIYTDALTEGILGTEAFWKTKGFDIEALHMYDGCGLAPSNSISPEMLCDILLYMQNKSKYADSFLASLPQAGKEGTVRNFLKGSRLEGLVSVKSGSIANVQCFAGYYINGNKKYAFSVMVNNFNSPHKDIVRAIETLLLDSF